MELDQFSSVVGSMQNNTAVSEMVKMYILNIVSL